MLINALRYIMPRVASATSASTRCFRKFALSPARRLFSTDFGDVPTFELQVRCSSFCSFVLTVPARWTASTCLKPRATARH
jgi:hypothetical protein